MKFYRIINKIGYIYVNYKCKKEYEAQKYKWINERPIEYSFVFKNLIKICPIEVLDVGTGITALPSLLRSCGYLVTAIDNFKDYWHKGMHNKHFNIINDDIVNTKLRKKFDLITCISVLEHIVDFNVAVKNMFGLLKPGGYLILTHPYSENKYIKNVYKLEQSSYGQNNPYICQVFSRKEVNKWINTNGGKIIDQEYWKVFEGDYWTFGNHLYPPLKVNKNEKHNLTCLIIRKVEVFI